jgi:hypothetical protein
VTVPDNQLCPVCDKGFETFSDHARCDGCFDAVHFRECSGYHEVTRDGTEHLYIFCLYCYSPDDVYQDEDGYYHPTQHGPEVVEDDFDWDALMDMLEEDEDEDWDR